MNKNKDYKNFINELTKSTYVIPKATEDTITVMLKDELETCGVKTEIFPEIKTPSGYRKPDLYCLNGGTYIIEAKFKEKDLWKAVAKIQNDYIKYYKLLGISGGFAVLYPEELAKPLPKEVVKKLANTLKFKVVMMFLPQDRRRNFHVVEGTIKEIANELARQILTPPEFVEPSVEYIINALRDIAYEITEGLRHLTGKQLEDLFGGKDVFENILQYEEAKYPEEDLRLASAYILVNQLLFYHVLSRRMPETFEEINPDSINYPSELQKKYFSNVLNVNYRAIFSYDVASRIPQSFIHRIKEMINAIQGLSAEKVGGDLLGTIFHDLIPFDVRKKVAAFYTNVNAADLLAWLAIDEKDSKVTDFACGSGGLLVAAYRRKKWLLEKEREFTEKDHKKFIEEDLLGIDVMPFAANIAACHLALQSPELFTNKVKIAIWDSTELVPGVKIPSIAHLEFILRGQQTLGIFLNKQKRGKGVVKLGEEEPEEILLECYDVIIMNPPFTRQERIPKNYKKILFERFKDKYLECLHGQMSYYGYFLLLADRFLKEGGKLAFVLPAAFLKTKSLEKIRKLLVKKFEVEYIVTGKRRLNFSEATWRREILFVARKLRDGEERKNTLIVALDALPKNLFELQELIQKINESKEGDSNYEDGKVIIRSINKKELEDDLDWFRFIASFGEIDISTFWESISSRSRESVIPFRELYKLDAILKRGIETSRGMKVQAVFIPRSRERIIRKEDYWIVHRAEKDYLSVVNRDLPSYIVKIPNYAIVPALRTIANNYRMDLSKETDFVVIEDFPESDKFFIGERKSLAKILPRWKEYVMERMGNLILLRRFPINAPGTIHLCYYSSQPIAGPGTTWVATLPEEEAKILCLWFNSSLHLAQILCERIEDIWLDVHKYILENMLVLNPRALRESERKKLLELFEETSKQSFPCLKEQIDSNFTLREKLDKTILEILGFSVEDSDELIPKLHEAIKRHFSILESMGK